MVARMKNILVVMLLLLGFISIAGASPNNIVSSSDQSSVSVVVFMDNKVFADAKKMNEMRGVLKEKFGYANSIEIYGDNQAKTPAFLDFVEKLKTDPINEKGIKVINMDALSQYAKDMKSKYVVQIVISTFDGNEYGYFFDTEASVSVIDVDSRKYLDYRNWYRDSEIAWPHGAQDTMKKIAAEFNWFPPRDVTSDKTINYTDKGSSVVVFISPYIQVKPDLVQKIRKTISEKFRESDVAVYIDDRPKSPEFLDLIGKVGTDSAKQQTFILRKDRLVEYGKSINSKTLTAIVISAANREGDYSFQLREEIFVVDIESNKYIANAVYDTDGYKKRQEGLEILMKKLQNEFKLP
jgi:hypothetical protein